MISAMALSVETL